MQSKPDLPNEEELHTGGVQLFGHHQVFRAISTFRWRCPDFFSSVLHRCFEVLPGGLPCVIHQRNMTTTHSLAGVFAWLGTAAPLSFAFVLLSAVMRSNCGACPLSGTRILPALPLSFAHVQAAADMLLLHQQTDSIRPAGRFGGVRSDGGV